MLLSAEKTDLTVRELVAQQGKVFAVFDASTQDSGNISYGVQLGERRLFVKTAGDPHDSRPFLSHSDRVALLRNGVRLGRSVRHEALPALRNVIEAVDGPIVVYDWVDGELLHTPAARRSDPTSAYSRFRELSGAEGIAALDVVFRLHVDLADRGWVASDFYDGSLIFDFANGKMHVVDLDSYRAGSFQNTMGRMFGSSRFMAPEEHLLGAQIDERTTVFALGRTIRELLASARTEVADVASRACEPDPERRFQTVVEFYEAWTHAVSAR